MQYYYLVATLARAARFTSSFTYHFDTQLPAGQLVQVEVGKKLVSGVVIEQVQSPNFATKAIHHVLDLPPLPKQILKIAEWLRDYYRSPEASVWQTLLPTGLGKKRRQIPATLQEYRRDRTTIVLNPQQTAALQAIDSGPPGTYLLQGITGSGKTQVYIEAAKNTINQNRSVIVLVPEIALTSQLIAEFSQHFPHIIVTHSRMTEAQRHHAWLQSLKTEQPAIIIGPRSALFSPVKNLGLIVIDESHEPSYKQEQTPRYSALRAASMLAQLHGAKLILGSATPNVVDRFLAETTKRPVIKLTTLARTHATTPQIEVIDMKKLEHFTKHSFISNALFSAINDGLSRQQQSLIFHNRRGSAPTTLCKNCGWQAACPHCFLPLTLHNDAFQLRCHLCNFTAAVPTACPQCGATEVVHKGIGTKAIEDALKRLFPKAKIFRFDADSASSETVDKLYQELYDGAIDIIIGTQVIAKGLDLPRLTTVGIIQADAGLNLPDFQADERVFQLVSQVRGRVGRNELSSKLVVQSYYPEAVSVQCGITQDYETFYQTVLHRRKQQHFPPFSHLLKLIGSYRTEQQAVKAARELSTTLRSSSLAIQIFGPAPAFYERLRGSYRWQLLVKSHDRQQLIAALDYLPPRHWQFELDPISLL
ncbi:MAG TPA: primosomal protein N' [Verrucomicrobiae bacterium]|nr:primosomal protein N' [Verrucomicrobiae bacterium]